MSHTLPESESDPGVSLNGDWLGPIQTGSESDSDPGGSERPRRPERPESESV